MGRRGTLITKESTPLTSRHRGRKNPAHEEPGELRNRILPSLPPVVTSFVAWSTYLPAKEADAT